jgi:hypothetical protein
LRLLSHTLIGIAGLCAAAPVFGEGVSIAGTFSAPRITVEGGNIQGVEISIIPRFGRPGEYIALVQLAVEEFAHCAAVTPVKVDGQKISFTLPKDGPYPCTDLSFSGVLDKTSLKGTWSDGRKEVLTRGDSH